MESCFAKILLKIKYVCYFHHMVNCFILHNWHPIYFNNYNIYHINTFKYRKILQTKYHLRRNGFLSKCFVIFLNSWVGVNREIKNHYQIFVKRSLYLSFLFLKVISCSIFPCNRTTPTHYYILLKYFGKCNLSLPIFRFWDNYFQT